MKKLREKRMDNDLIRQEYHKSFQLCFFLWVFSFVAGFILSKFDWLAALCSYDIISFWMQAFLRFSNYLEQIYCRRVSSQIFQISSFLLVLAPLNFQRLKKVAKVSLNFVPSSHLTLLLLRSYSETLRFSCLFSSFEK